MGRRSIRVTSPTVILDPRRSDPGTSKITKWDRPRWAASKPGVTAGERDHELEREYRRAESGTPRSPVPGLTRSRAGQPLLWAA
jgi:hypothetical protein